MVDPVIFTIFGQKKPPHNGMWSGFHDYLLM